MGSHYTRPQSAKSYAAEVGWVTRRENQARMTLADKIVMALTDKISAELIRPGPVAEERECYEMARELREMGPDLNKLVAAILTVAAKEDEE